MKEHMGQRGLRSSRHWGTWWKSQGFSTAEAEAGCLPAANPASLGEGRSWGICCLAIPVCPSRAEITLRQRTPSDREMKWWRQEASGEL